MKPTAEQFTRAAVALECEAKEDEQSGHSAFAADMREVAAYLRAQAKAMREDEAGLTTIAQQLFSAPTSLKED